MSEQKTAPRDWTAPKRADRPGVENPAAPLKPTLMRLARELRAEIEAGERGAA